MVLKVSINLPSQGAITVEASEPELLRVALRELSSYLVQIYTPGTPTTSEETSARPSPPQQPSAAPAPAGEEDNAAREQLAQFYRRLDPMGDMRKVVAAAAGASRYLGMQSVSARELGDLFDLAGWPRPADFIQTLRNAARSTFRWMARVPGRSGYYTATTRGEEVVLGSGTA